jgi:hypothetical protein
MTKMGGYRSWQSMRQRCENPKDSGYPDYGGRGIKVCEKWKTFEGFWADMGHTWAAKLTIERRDANGDYEPGNCCWIPRADQSKNRRTVDIIETPWGAMLLPEAASRLGLSHAAMWQRYKKGWRGDKLFSPPMEKGARITYRKAG